MSDWKKTLNELKRGLAAAKSGPSPDLRESQFGRPSHKPKPIRHLCIGLDFGTSSTKAVIQVLPGGPAFAVPLAGSGAGEELYLAPTRLWVAHDGAASLCANGAGGWVEELKVSLMEQPWTQVPCITGADVLARPIDLAASYLALILRAIFEWFQRELSPKLGEVEISWSMNLGIPARDFDAAQIREAFLVAARAGWLVARERGAIDVGRAEKAVNAAKLGPSALDGIPAELIQVVPEVAAGVTAYARSPQRQGGAHLFVDVGATTVDSSMFLLSQTEDGLKYVFLSADVDSGLGALRLHRYRANELGRLALQCFAASDPLKPVPATARECIPSDEDIDRIDSKFRDACVLKVGSVVYFAKLKAPAEISVPESGPSGVVQVLLSGGGIRLPLYQEVIQECGRRGAPGGGLGLRVRPFRIERIPQPANLQAPGLTPETWDRLAVAFGLSYRFEDIGEFVPPSAVSVVAPRRPQEHEAAFVSKDQV